MEIASLLIGVLCKDKDALTNYSKILKDFGTPKILSPIIPFDFTQYYFEAMGRPLFRRFFIYSPGFLPDTLPDVKNRTIALERTAAAEWDLGVERPLNLDPGYLTLSKLVLASTKDHAHRIYLRDGIFAEITLRYHEKSYRPWPWTFPDYRSAMYIDFFMGARKAIFRKK